MSDQTENQPTQESSKSGLWITFLILVTIIVVYMLAMNFANQDDAPKKDYIENYPTATMPPIVMYEIGGTTDAASLTWENDTNGTDQGDYKVPFFKSFKGFRRGDFVYISAQNMRETGNVTCKITYNGIIIAEAKASGKFAIATCSERLP